MGSNYREVTGISLLAAGSMTSVISSAALELRGYTSASIHFQWVAGGGAPVGEFKIEGSHDGLTDWVDMGIGIIGPAGTSSKDLVDLQRVGVPYVRLTYTPTSGTGLLTVTGNKKGC